MNETTTTATTAVTAAANAILSLRAIYSAADSDRQYSHLFRASLLAFVGFYYAVSPFYKTPKQKSWILTTLSAFLMTACSVPFLLDYFRGGFSVAASPISSPFAYGVNKVFQAYLVADLALGALHYRKQVNLLSGWIHHAMYVVVTEYAMRNGLAGLFALAAAMEAPTFLLGLGSLHSRARTDVGFASIFFITRIVFNAALIYAYSVKANREGLLEGSWVPASVLTMAFGMHAMWFKGCVNGFVKRAREAKAKRMDAEVKVKVIGLKGLEVSSEPVPVPALTAATIASTTATAKPAPRFATLPRRRERKTFRAEIPALPPAAPSIPKSHSHSHSPAHARRRSALPDDYLSASWHAGSRTPPPLFSGSGSSDTESDEEVHTPFDGVEGTRGPVVVGVDCPSDPSSSSTSLRLAQEQIAKPWSPPAPVPILRLPLNLGRTEMVDAMGTRARLRLRALRERIRARGADVVGRLRLGGAGLGEGAAWGYHEGGGAGGVPGGFVGVGGVEAAERTSPVEVVAY
ncbi:hypothetical protein SCHPADRAFT_890870 [Schizopora paradoxa]|uniref:Uncharacterized protein n=1 Tax=Schizopora paradoxa TaxID=27342 RepID=A0A0H2RS69_9AGAM|nr:hypothetical protein SCHPADRAFT_890870 [Schizopora paradoxa]